MKKALGLVAFGFLLTLVDINLTLNGTSVNVTPDFIGWILIFLAYDALGAYITDKPYLKWAALTLALVNAGLWFAGILYPEISLDILKTVTTIVAAVFMFIFFGVLQRVARDYNSRHEGTIGYLRYLNAGLFLVLTVLTFFYGRMPLETFAAIFAGFGVIALAAAIFTAVILFRFRNEITE